MSVPPSSTRFILSALIFLGLGVPLSAQAGFEWVPPAQNTVDTALPAKPLATARIEPVESTAAGDIVVVPSAPDQDKKSSIQSEPLAITSAPTTVPEKTTGALKSSSYPPADNRAAAPLAGTRTAQIVPTSTARKAPEGPNKPTPSGPKVDTAKPVDIIPPTPPASDETATRATKTYGVIDGFGRDIPLSLAIEQIVPADFTVTYDAQPNPDTIVSWAGGRAWDKVLEDMLYAHGYRVMVGQKTVTIFKAGKTPSVTTRNLSSDPVSIATTPIRETLGVAVPVPEMAAPKPATGYQAQKVDIFSASSGETLSTVLNRWVRQAGVQLDWQMDRDLTMKASTSYNAVFTRAIEQVLGQFRDQNARPIAELHPNAPSGPAVLTIRPATDSTMIIR